jgi:hypothetical protein
MKKIYRAALLLAALAASACGAWAQEQAGQTTLTQTTLTVAVNSATTTIVTVASATNIVAPNNQGSSNSTLNSLTQIDLYADGELMQVTGVNGTNISILRGMSGTLAVQHASGAVVWSGPAASFNRIDPSGVCNVNPNSPFGALAPYVTPYINITDGRLFRCDSVTGMWFPALTTGSITPVATSAAIQTAGQTFTVPGIISGEPLAAVSSPAPTSLCPLTAVRATAANTVTLYFSVLTAAACTPASGVYWFIDPIQNVPLVRR